MRRIGSAMMCGAAAAALASLAGCASAAPANAPAWFDAKLKALEHGYPRLQDVPQTTIANTDTQHWAQVQSDIAAAQQELQSNPRDQVAAGVDPQGFQAQALQDLADTRAAHGGQTSAPGQAPAQAPAPAN